MPKTGKDIASENHNELRGNPLILSSRKITAKHDKMYFTLPILAGMAASAAAFPKHKQHTTSTTSTTVGNNQSLQRAALIISIGTTHTYFCPCFHIARLLPQVLLPFQLLCCPKLSGQLLPLEFRNLHFRPNALHDVGHCHYGP